MIGTTSGLESSFAYIPSKYKCLSNSAFSIVYVHRALVKLGAAALYQMQQKWECSHARQSTAELERYEESKTKYSFKIRWAQVCFFSPARGM